jgi:hypothetical protein
MTLRLPRFNIGQTTRLSIISIFVTFCVFDDKKRYAIAISVRTFEKIIPLLEKAMWLVQPSNKTAENDYCDIIYK